MIEADLDRHALAAKSVRMADAEWLRARTAPLPGMSVPATAPAPVQLGVGRPRTATVLVYVTLVLRGFYRLCLHLPEVFDLPRIDVRWCEARRERMHRHDFHIDTASGKGRAQKRVQAYRRFYGLAEKLIAHLRHQFEAVLEPAVCGLDVRPSVGAAVQEACTIIRTSIADAGGRGSLVQRGERPSPDSGRRMEQRGADRSAP
jgi:hypothetical protein